jgi:protein TonB
MPHDLFGDAVVRPASRRVLRRTLTVCSIALHAVVIAVIVVAQLLAVGPLPTPRSPLTYTVVHLVEPPIDIPTERRPVPAAGHDTPTVSPNAAPLEAPDRITEETGRENERITDARPDIVVGVERGGTDLLNGVIEGGRLPPPPPPVPQTPIHLHSGIQPPRKIVDITPTYPSLAQISRTEGIVILEATIDVRGAVTDVRVLRSIPLLDQAALEAVKQWRYTPALLNGVPVPVIMSVTVRFALNR